MALGGRTDQWDGAEDGDEPLPAPTGDVQGHSGWRRQASGLSQTHAAVGMAAMAVTGQQPRPADPAESILASAGGGRKAAAAFANRLPGGAARTRPEMVIDPSRPSLVEMHRDAIREAMDRILNPSNPSPNPSPSAPTGPLHATAANEEVASLESELAATREDVLRRDNENRSLQASLDLLRAENARLSGCLKDSEAAIARKADDLVGELRRAREALLLRDKAIRTLEASNVALTAEKTRLSVSLAERDAAVGNACDELQKIRAGRDATAATLTAERNAAIAAFAAERDKMTAERTALSGKCERLAAALEQTKASHIGELGALHARIETMAARAVTAERVLAEAKASWLDRVEANSSTERRLAEMIDAWTAADRKLAQVDGLLEARDGRIRELEEARAALTDGANHLLQAVHQRDSALIRADERIRLLTERLAEVETAVRTVAWHQLSYGTPQVTRDVPDRAVVELASDAEVPAALAMVRSPSEIVLSPIEAEAAFGYAAPDSRTAQMLLADTITFFKAA